MKIIQHILFLAFTCYVYGQLNLQKREFKAPAVAGLPEGHIYNSEEIAAHYDSIIPSSNAPRLGSMRRGSESQRADRSYQKPPISGKITDYSHNTGIGGYRWRKSHHKISFRKSIEALKALNKYQLEKRRDRKVTLSPIKYTGEVQSSSQRKHNAESSQKLSEMKKYGSGRLSLDLPASAESSGGELGNMKKFSSGRRSMNLSRSRESSPSDSPRDQFFQDLPQLPRAEDFRGQRIRSHSTKANPKSHVKGMIDWFRNFRHRLSYKASSSGDACQTK